MSDPSTTPLERFVTSLTQAWRRLLLYPEGHPERLGAIEEPFEVLGSLVAVTDGLKLGVAAEELVVGDASLSSLAAKELAHALYQRTMTASCSFMVSMLARVHLAGCSPRSRAAFSAGRPKASHPMGWSTENPCARL